MTEYMDEPTTPTEDEARKPHPHSPGYGVTRKFPTGSASEAPSPASDAESEIDTLADDMARQQGIAKGEALDVLSRALHSEIDQ